MTTPLKDFYDRNGMFKIIKSFNIPQAPNLVLF